MSSVYKAAGGASDLGSGGKIVRRRRAASARTPYDRPEPTPPQQRAQPAIGKANWLSAAGRVLSGAGKLISSVVIGSDSSSSESGWGSDDEVEDGLPETEAHELIRPSELKQKIEELLMQETFSREESDRLIQIIRSRTVDGPILADNQESDLHSTAVIEARKWIEERKKGSGSKSDLDYSTRTLSTALAPHITEGEAGSPVDVARTYMRARPPWASPTATLSEIRSPTPVKIQTLAEGSSYPNPGAGLSSQAKKRDYVASGSWSIAEEMRKVRARATDELLSTPSRKLDLSAFSLKREPKPDTVQDGLEENLAGSSSFTLAAATADKDVDPAALVPTSTGSTALDTAHDGPLQEPLSSVTGMDMDDMAAAPCTCEGTEVLTIPEDRNGVEGVALSAENNAFQETPCMPEGATLEPNAASLVNEDVRTNTHNEEVSDHTSQATTEIPPQYESELDGFTGSQQTANEESTQDASKSSPEVIVAVQANKRQTRAKQPGRRGRGRGK
uniref:Protein KAKU4 n=1 Tax=Kalanchoe fedtschenkoi TaxID=63787 RepID=A0A7N0TCE6_KALFE